MTTVRTPPLFLTDVVIVGGCGRVGLPLGVALASRGLGVVLCDINAAAVQTVNDGRLPFAEPGAAQLLADAVREGRLRATTDPLRGRTWTRLASEERYMAAGARSVQPW